LNYSTFIPIFYIIFLLLFRNLPLLYSQEQIGLKECIALAQLENIGIITDRLERQDAWKRLHLQIRIFFPEISLSYSKSDSISINAPDSRINKLGLSFNQLLFNGGRDLADYRSAVRELKLRDLTAEDMLDQIAHQLSLEYIEILKNREILLIQKQSLENLEEQIEISELEYSLGGLTETDLLDIRIRAVQYSLNIQDTEERLLQSRFKLAELMNIPLARLPALRGSLNLDYQGIYRQKMTSDASYITLLKEEAEEFNKELMSHYLKEMNAERALLDSKISWIPKIEANADLNIAGSEYPLNETSFSLGLNFSFNSPLFPGSLSLNAGKSNPDEHNSSISSDISAVDNLEALIAPSIARNGLYTTKLEIDELKRLIAFKVEALAKSIILNEQRCSISREKIIMESEKLNIESIRVEMGELTRLEYVKSEIRLANHRTELIEGIAALYSNEIELEMSCGIDSSRVDSFFSRLINTEGNSK
jgi:outer membrane protein